MKQPTILIADDDFAIADVISMILEGEGYIVRHVSDGREILKMEANLPDLLLLDIKLGKMDGEDICRKLRQDNFFDNMRVLLLSADPAIATRAAAACADDYIAKPFEINELLEKIRKNLVDSA